MKIKFSDIFFYTVLISIIGLVVFLIFGGEKKEVEFSSQIFETQNTQINSIAELTNENTVISYLKANQKLPDYYITKSEARKLGWKPETGNLCKVLPGRAIGGDYFGNRENRLPKKPKRKYFEADINYDCGRRDAERLIFSNDGLIFITKDHYKTFQKR